jgi:large subunit ribosomal protein L21
MKKAIIATGGKQYFVKEGDTVDIELVKDKKVIEFQPLLIIDGDKTLVGQPIVNGAKVVAEVVEPLVKGDKVLSIRFEAKKRVKKVQGHRQQRTRITIKAITLK